MPILDAPNEDAPLSQGDVLKGLRLHSTGSDWDDQKTPGGNAEWARRYELCLVLSRPCVLEHKDEFLVAPVHAVQEQSPTDVTSLAEAEHFLTNVRDGKSCPDRFYLGQIPNSRPGRYYAHLDSIHTIAKPPADKLQQFLRNARIAALASDFVRDLHVRLFSAFASLGFDDVGWLSNHDLKWLVDWGRKDLLEGQQALQQVNASLSGMQASGEQRHPKHLKSDEERLANLEQKIAKLREKLEPYEYELQARQG